MIKVALYGKPGAGKSTLAELLNREFSAMGRPVVTLKLAAPLYTLQAVIHTFAGRPMTDGSQQDGLLLNDLAAHLRRINPAALTEPFARRLAQAAALHPDGVALCDDMRAADVEALRALHFTLVEVSAPEELRRTRKAARNDLSPGNDDHPTEAVPTCEPHHRVINDGDVHLLRRRAAELAREVLR
ncbi:ATP-binding protein [Microbispora sp. H10885]|uniref:ATP-binding protein n=1 Tax=Microbispora sp. H10885 TaxID=2729110 RepID=UPI00160247BF|nr:ATP-binding protein [Microbispora sp. H10885]